MCTIKCSKKDKKCAKCGVRINEYIDKYLNDYFHIDFENIKMFILDEMDKEKYEENKNKKDVIVS